MRRKKTIINDEERERFLRPYMLASVSDEELENCSIEQLFTAVILTSAEEDYMRREQRHLDQEELQRMDSTDPRRRPVASELARTMWYRDDLRRHMHRVMQKLYKRICPGGDQSAGPDPERVLEYFWDYLGVALDEDEDWDEEQQHAEKILTGEKSWEDAKPNGLHDTFFLADRIGGGKGSAGGMIRAKNYDDAGVALLVDQKELD